MFEKYELKKSVSFNLAGKDTDLKKIKDIGLKKKCETNDKYKLLQNFINKYEKFIKLNKEVFFSDGKEYFRNKLLLNYKFLDIHLKQEYYISKQRKIGNKNIKIIDKNYKFLRDFLIQTFDNNCKLFDQLKNYSSKGENEKNRFSEINFILQNLNSKNIYIFKNLYENLKQTNDKNLDDKIDKQKVEIIQISQDILVLLGEFGINNGIEIAKGSFNYFTLNKTSKIYVENEIKNLNHQKSIKIKDFKNNLFKLKLSKYEELILDDKYFEEIGLNKKELENMTIVQVYDFLKDFKAKRKSAFIQFVSNDYSKDDLENNIKSIYKYQKDGVLIEEELSVELFKDIGENFDDFKRLCLDIKELGNKLSVIYQKYNVNKNGLLKLIEKNDKILNEDDINLFNKLVEEKDKKSQERGDYFNKPCKNQKVYTKNYKTLCDFYKSIALKYGEIKAKLAGFEKQKIEAEKLRYFGVIIEKDNSKYLGLIPKENEKHKLAYELLKSKSEENGEIKAYYFESLTLRALQKLCFKEEKNTFMRNEESNVENELRNKFNYRKIKRFDEFKIGKKGFEIIDEKGFEIIDEKGLIKFYKDVLKTKSAQKMLSLDKFNFNQTTIFTDEFKNLQEFEIELEKYAYKKVCVGFSKEEFDKFLKDCKILEYEISTEDLKLNRKNKTKNKNHTNYWLDFWSKNNLDKNYDIRLNPEFSIYFRVGDKNLKDKFKHGLLPESKILGSYRNRFSKDKLTFVSNITLNSNNKKINLSYKLDDELNEIITKFNNDIETKLDKNNTWYFGIDRGLNELATLSIVKFLDENGKNFELGNQKIYRLKEEYSKIQEIIYDKEKQKLVYNFKTIDFPHSDGSKRKFDFQPAKNLSYFINNPEYDYLFEDVEVGNIDLTQAKIFGDKIVENADIMTHLRLKELAAKRAIFDLYSNGLVDDNFEITYLNGEKGLFVKLNNSYYIQFYWFISQLRNNSQYKKDKKEKIEELQKILKKNFTDFIKDLKHKNFFSDIITISKINHLRDSLASNLVGILFYLYEKYGNNGKIIFENTDQKLDDSDFKIIENHFLQSNEFVERRYELAIYNKFQQIGIVPPNLTKSVLLKDLYNFNKFGLVNFIHTGKTSSICPMCLENLGFKDKLKKHLFKNKGDCFSKLPRELQDDTECDKIAAFTIAKFGYKNIFTEKDLTKNYNKTQTSGIEFKRSK